MSTDTHVFDLLPAYALGSLDREESNRVALHLDDCALCQKELRAYQSVVNQLPFAVPERIPPARLKQAILASAEAQGNASRTPAPTRPSAELSFLTRVRQHLLGPVPGWSLVAIILALIVLLAGNILLLQRSQRLAAASANEFRIVRMAGTVSAANATGWIVISQDGTAGTLIVQNLPSLDQSHQYQLWLIRDGNRVSGGVFSVDDRGYASVWVYSPRPLIQYQTFGITVEPIGGSPGPTGSKVLGGSL